MPVIDRQRVPGSEISLKRCISITRIILDIHFGCDNGARAIEQFSWRFEGLCQCGIRSRAESKNVRPRDLHELHPIVSKRLVSYSYEERTMSPSCSRLLNWSKYRFSSADEVGPISAIPYSPVAFRDFKRVMAPGAL